MVWGCGGGKFYDDLALRALEKGFHFLGKLPLLIASVFPSLNTPHNGYGLRVNCLIRSSLQNHELDTILKLPAHTSLGTVGLNFNEQNELSTWVFD